MQPSLMKSSQASDMFSSKGLSKGSVAKSTYLKNINNESDSKYSKRNIMPVVYTWGSGEMGQLGYNNKIIGQMPKDREGYPF